MELDRLQALQRAEHGQRDDVAVAARQFIALPDLAEDVVNDEATERSGALLGGRGEANRLAGHRGQ